MKISLMRSRKKTKLLLRKRSSNATSNRRSSFKGDLPLLY
jgi:hypothetical protein